MAASVVQFQIATGIGATLAPTLASSPTVGAGRYLVAMAFGVGGTNVATADPSWVRINGTGSGVPCIAAIRPCTAGDTGANLPAMFTAVAGNGAAVACWEVAAANGTPDTSMVGLGPAGTASAVPTTATANDLILIAFGTSTAGVSGATFSSTGSGPDTLDSGGAAASAGTSPIIAGGAHTFQVTPGSNTLTFTQANFLSGGKRTLAVALSPFVASTGGGSGSLFPRIYGFHRTLGSR